MKTAVRILAMSPIYWELSLADRLEAVRWFIQQQWYQFIKKEN